MAGLSITLELQGRTVLVVGGGRAAGRAVRSALVAGAQIRWISDGREGRTFRATRAELDAGVVGPGPAPHRRSGWAALIRTVDLVQVVADDSDLVRTAVDACRAARVLWAPLPADVPGIGRVTLVGSGPGGPDLMTARGRDALASADVVLLDRLASRSAVAELAPGAQLIEVGKRPGHHPVPQHRIEELMIEHALAGCHVVRLKGGDPFVFGRGGEEVAACRAAGVPVEVVSGISSALAVPAAAGIPVTHREVAHAFTVVSGHAPLTEPELRSLAGLGGTIVVLMGVLTLPHLTAGLLRHGLDAETPAAVIERGFGPQQRTTVATLGTLVSGVVKTGVRSPAVIVIGDVVSLRSILLPGGELPFEDWAVDPVESRP